MHRRPSMCQEKIQDRYVESWRLTSLPQGIGWKACRPADRKRRVQREGRRYGLPWEHKDAVPLGRQYNGERTQIPLISCWPEAVKLRLAAVRVPPTIVFLYRRGDCVLMGSHEHLPEKERFDGIEMRNHPIFRAVDSLISKVILSDLLI